MHVKEKKDGTLEIDDEPVRIKGAEARRVRDEMRKLDEGAQSEERKRILEDAERVYRSSRTGRSS